jgi:hypothetical protein
MSHPRVGQCVRVRYGKGRRAFMPHHDKLGVVEIVSTGRPRNHGVRLRSGLLVVIPAGNIQPERP